MQMKTDRRLCTREDSWWKRIEAQQRQFDMFNSILTNVLVLSWTYKMCAGRTGCKQGSCKQFEHVVCYDNSRIFEGYLYWGTLAHFGSSFLRANRRITCFFNLGLLPEEKCFIEPFVCPMDPLLSSLSSLHLFLGSCTGRKGCPRHCRILGEAGMDPVSAERLIDRTSKLLDSSFCYQNPGCFLC